VHLKGFGCQDKIQIGDREFRIHTGCDTNKNKALSEVFEKGNFVFELVKPYQLRQSAEKRVDEKYLKNIVLDLHQQIIDEVLILFQINHKIKDLKQYLPHYRLGKVLLSKNFYKEAIDNLRFAIELNPDYIRAYKLLGLAYLKVNEYKNALRTFTAALKVKPDYPDILNCLGVLYTQMGDYESAKNHLQESIKIKSTFMESNFNFGVVLFLSTIAENPNEENVVLPARIIRSLKEIREIEYYQEEYWQKLFEQVFDAIKLGTKNVIIEALYDLQIKMITRGDLYVTMDVFFLKFMYGGREMEREEIDMYERKIISEADKFDNFADYWNDLAVLHLIQCRDNFLKAIDEFDHSLKLNPKFEEAENSLELIKRGKKGFLILLRAILK